MAKSSLAHPLIVLLLSAFGASFADAQAIPDGSYEGYFHSDVDMPFTLQVSDTEWAGTVTGNDGKAAYELRGWCDQDGGTLGGTGISWLPYPQLGLVPARVTGTFSGNTGAIAREVLVPPETAPELIQKPPFAGLFFLTSDHASFVVTLVEQASESLPPASAAGDETAAAAEPTAADRTGSQADPGEISDTAALLAMAGIVGTGLLALGGWWLARVLRPPVAAAPPYASPAPPAETAPQWSPQPAQAPAVAATASQQPPSVHNPRVYDPPLDWPADPNLDPKVRQWLAAPKSYDGDWLVTPDGKYVTVRLDFGTNRMSILPVDVITGASTNPDADLFSTPVPEESHARLAERLAEDLPMPREHFAAEGWRKLTEAERQADATIAAVMIASQLGVGDLQMKFDPNFRYAGEWNPNTVPPTLTVGTGRWTWDDPAEVFDTIAHEVRHGQQNDLANPMENSTLRAVMTKNCAPGKYIALEADPVRYAAQAMERDSQSLGRRVSRAVAARAPRRLSRDQIGLVVDKIAGLWDPVNPVPRTLSSHAAEEFMDQHPDHRERMIRAVREGWIVIRE